jgi:hypothetical protein
MKRSCTLISVLDTYTIHWKKQKLRKKVLFENKDTNILEGGIVTEYLILGKKLHICVNCTEVTNEVVY